MKILDWCKKNYLFLIISAALITAANFFLWQFYRQEKYIYFWDWSYYESTFKFITEKFYLRFGVFRAVKSVLGSIAFTDHSFLAPFILSPLGLIFGTSRAVYLFSVLNIFALPSALLLGILIARIFGNQTSKKWLFALIPIFLLLTTPQFWIPLLLGFYDASILVVVGLIWLLLSSDWQKKSLAKLILIGFLLAIMVFIRRWTGYWVASFFVAIFLQWSYCKIKKQQPFWDFKKMVICGASSLITFLIFAAPIAKEMILSNYGQMFSAYKAGNSTVAVILHGAYHYGWLALVFALLGAILAFRDAKIRPFAQIITLQALITLFLFSRVQEIDQHHHYQFLIVIVLFQSLFLFYLLQSKIAAAWKWLGSLVFFIFLILNFGRGLIPNFPFSFQPSHLLAGANHHPLKREDTGEIKNLVEYLGQIGSKDDTIYVLASSVIFNDDILRNACLYLELDNTTGCAKVTNSFAVDLRDGFPKQLLDANYVVVANPVQYHLRPIDQQVVGVPAKDILDNKGIGVAFEKLPQEFKLDGGVTVKIFKKSREFTAQELKDLEQEFLQAYPGREDLFKILGE